MTTHVDKAGIQRGACSCGDCPKYEPGKDRLKCCYCDCLPIKHAQIGNPAEQPSPKKIKLEQQPEGNPAEQPVPKKIKVDQQPEVSIPILKMHPCELLHKSHLPLKSLKIGPTMKGVYKIAYKWETIFVGKASSFIANQIKKHLGGKGHKKLFNYLKNLSPEEIEDVSVYWLDDEQEHVHSCGKTYLKCISKIQGKTPMFSVTGKKTQHCKDDGTTGSDLKKEDPQTVSNILPTGTNIVQGASYLGIYQQFSDK